MWGGGGYVIPGSVCTVLRVEYRASEALAWPYTRLPVLETQPRISYKLNSSHSSNSLFLPLLNLSLATWLGGRLSGSLPPLGNGRYENSAFRSHLLKAKQNDDHLQKQTKQIVELKEGVASV